MGALVPLIFLFTVFLTWVIHNGTFRTVSSQSIASVIGVNEMKTPDYSLRVARTK